MITKQTALDLFHAYDEMEKGAKLLEELEAQSREGSSGLKDSFGRIRPLQLGLPCGDASHRLLNVPPALAAEVIKAHIAAKQAELKVIQERARHELDADQTTHVGGWQPITPESPPCYQLAWTLEHGLCRRLPGGWADIHLNDDGRTGWEGTVHPEWQPTRFRIMPGWNPPQLQPHPTPTP